MFSVLVKILSDTESEHCRYVVAFSTSCHLWWVSLTDELKTTWKLQCLLCWMEPKHSIWRVSLFVKLKLWRYLRSSCWRKGQEAGRWCIESRRGLLSGEHESLFFAWGNFSKYKSSIDQKFLRVSKNAFSLHFCGWLLGKKTARLNSSIMSSSV